MPAGRETPGAVPRLSHWPWRSARESRPPAEQERFAEEVELVNAAAQQAWGDRTGSLWPLTSAEITTSPSSSNRSWSPICPCSPEARRRGHRIASRCRLSISRCCTTAVPFFTGDPQGPWHSRNINRAACCSGVIRYSGAGLGTDLSTARLAGLCQTWHGRRRRRL